MMKELICIVCPMGCHMDVDMDNEFKTTGNQCPRGQKYAVDELTAPTRVVTSSVKIEGGIYNRLTVKTADAIPKGLIFKCMDEINKIEVKSPVKMGDIIIKNVLDTGVDIVATRNM